MMKSSIMRFMVKKSQETLDPVQRTPFQDVLPQSAFSSQGPDTLVNSGADFFTPAKRRAVPAKPSQVAPKRRKVDNEDDDGGIGYAEFVQLTRKTLHQVSETHLGTLHNLETELCLIPEALAAIERNDALLPPYVVAKKISVLNQKSTVLHAKIAQARASQSISALREVIIQYILQYKKAQSASQRADVVEDFLGRFGPATVPVHRCNIMVCPTCEIPMNIRSDDGFLLCVRCKTTQVHSERPLFVGPNGGGDDADLHIVSNKKENNFRDYLHLLQGKKLNPQLEASFPRIVQSLQGLVASEAPSRGVSEAIVDGLATLGLRKFAKYVVLIEARLRKVPVTQIPLQFENRMCSMFLIIVDPYERNKPVHRKHFISYAYCAWQFCRIENWVQFFPLFRLLKDEKKIEQQDLIFQPICVEVGWKFESPLRYRYCV